MFPTLFKASNDQIVDANSYTELCFKTFIPRIIWIMNIVVESPIKSKSLVNQMYFG